VSIMPFTPLHIPFAWIISRLDKRLPLPALIVGSVIPDIECPFLILFFSGVLPDHYILHSLIGALSIGLILAVILTAYVYADVASFLFGIEKKELKERCKVTRFTVLAAAIGVLSHLLIDYPMHPYNQILWPFVDANKLVGPLVSFFAMGGNITMGYLIANILTSMVSIMLWIAIVYHIRDELWKRMWMGDTTEETHDAVGASH